MATAWGSGAPQQFAKGVFRVGPPVLFNAGNGLSSLLDNDERRRKHTLIVPHFLAPDGQRVSPILQHHTAFRSPAAQKDSGRSWSVDFPVETLSVDSLDEPFFMGPAVAAAAARTIHMHAPPRSLGPKLATAYKAQSSPGALSSTTSLGAGIGRTVVSEGARGNSGERRGRGHIMVSDAAGHRTHTGVEWGVKGLRGAAAMLGTDSPLELSVGERNGIGRPSKRDVTLFAERQPLSEGVGRNDTLANPELAHDGVDGNARRKALASDELGSRESDLRAVAATAARISTGTSGRFLREFEMGTRLGQGGFGRVYAARHRLDACDYAIKAVVVYPEAQDAHRADQIAREVQTLARASTHAHVVRYHTSWIEPLTDSLERSLGPLPGSCNTSDTDGKSNANFVPGDAGGCGERSPSDRHSRFGFLSQAASATSTLSPFASQSSLSPTFPDLPSPLISVSTRAKMQDFSRHNSHDSLSASGGMSTCSPTSSHDHHDIQNYTSTHTNLDLHKNISDSITTQASTSAVFASAAAPPPSEEAIHDLPSVLFVQMELLSGRTLKDWLRDDMGRRNPDSGDVTGASTLDASAGVREDAMWQVEVCAVFRQVLQALDHVHGLGFVHRDVKPDNVFLAQESDVAAPMVKIGDFGLSVRCDLADGAPASDVVPSTGGPGAVGLHTAGVGTHLYASPEQVRGQACDGRADMFAVGVMLYESLCGPFATSMERVHVLGELATGSGVGFSSHFCDLHSRFPDLMNVVKGLLQLDPHSRPTAGTLLRDPIFCQHQLAPAPSAGLAERVELAHVVREQELLIAVLRAQLQRASPPDPGHVNVAHTDPGRYTRIEC